jgi:hypothetical protein
VDRTNGTEGEINDIADWVISQGKIFYLDVWNNPEKFPSSSSELSQEEMLYIIPSRVFKKRFQKLITEL